MEWQENLGELRDSREALHRVASDARQAACFTAGASEGDYGTFTWTDYTETPARKFHVRYYSHTAHSDGSRNLLREEIVDASPPRTTSVGDVKEFSISRENRLIRAWVKIPSWAEEGSDTPILGISALMRAAGPAGADC